jgi:energy-coupling factor transporter ATP-binding protein EcfA2
MRLREGALPDQGELRVIVNAIHAALEYSPLSSAPKHHHDVYAYVARQIEERFWTDIYVDRPEIKQIIFTLDTGRLTLITGERGTGKSTAIRAVIQELTGSPEVGTGIDPAGKTPNLIPYVFDANKFTAALTTEESVSGAIHRDMFEYLDAQIQDRSAWLSYLYEKHDSFFELRLTLQNEKASANTPEGWHYFATQDNYADIFRRGIQSFAATPVSERLKALLGFIGERTTYEPLLIIDNVDHLSNDLVRCCGLVLATIRQSSEHRVRIAIALRPETVKSIQSGLDTVPQPQGISMMQRSLSAVEGEGSSVDVTLRFLEKRMAVLREPQTVAVMRDAIDPEKASRLATDLRAESVEELVDHLMEILDLMIYDIFRSDENDRDLREENYEFADAVHRWHNGSLRECALSMTTFAAEILNDEHNIVRLRDILGLDSSTEPEYRRARLRRVSRSLLYRHLMLWAAPAEADPPQPLKNVMVFDGKEEATDPPIHFLRLRILQYLAHRPNARAKVEFIRSDLMKLDLEERRIDDALRELSVKRTQDDAGLLRIDGPGDDELGAPLSDHRVPLLECPQYESGHPAHGEHPHQRDAGAAPKRCFSRNHCYPFSRALPGREIHRRAPLSLGVRRHVDERASP